jgi:pyruvate formate lyase activating enzyme
MKKAMFYKKLKGRKVKCTLCPRSCTIPEGKTGYCGVRKNVKGELYSLVYGKLCSINIDPLEKKPIFMFAPGTQCLSIATVGCNLGCLFCQNWQISHPSGGSIFGEETTAERVIEMTKKNGLPGIAYTYTEPAVALEFYLEVMKLARKAGLYNVWVSNGYINPEPAKQAARYLDAINVDIKGDKRFYQKLCGVPDPKPIFDALKEYKKQGVWIEVTNLIVPGWNDREGQIRKIAEWVKNNLGAETPLHFSAFYPDYKLVDVPPTPLNSLEKAAETAEKAGLRYTYIGNVLGHKKESTYCWKCGEVLIERRGFEVLSIKDRCPKCGERIPIAGKKWMV